MIFVRKLIKLLLTFDQEQRHAVRPQPYELAPAVLPRGPGLGDPLRHPGPVELQRPHPVLGPRHTPAAVEVECPDGELGDVEDLAQGAGLHRVEECVIAVSRGEVEQGRVAGELVTQLSFADTLDHRDKVSTTAGELDLFVKSWHSESAVRTSWEPQIIVSGGIILINHCRHFVSCITVTNLDQCCQEPDNQEGQGDVKSPVEFLFSSKSHLRIPWHATCNELHVTRDTLCVTV